METFLGIMIPFLGTTLGAACVFFMKKSLGDLVQRSLAGFAAGVMVAASIWSLLIPAIEQSENMGKLSFLPAFIGFWSGVLFLLLLDRLIPHLHVGSEQAEGPKSKLGRTTMMVLAVTLHNIPEGMAVGVVYAGFLSGNTQITAASALALSLGIAFQKVFYRFCQRLILGIEERESCLIPANATIAIYCYCFPERSTCPIQIIVPSEGKCLQIIVKLSNLNIRKFLI